MKTPLHSRKSPSRHRRWKFVLLAWLATAGFAGAELEYPFTFPDGLSATLEVDTSAGAPVSRMLLGLNCSWPENQYGKTGYNNPAAQKLIKELAPPVLRWPHGVWANFYDWESDGRRITDNYQTPYDGSVKGHPDLKYGFDGFKSLHDTLKFDVVFTWNINYDSPEKGLRRLLDRREKGFQVKWIELGNETFWKTQRSEAVSDVGKYIAVSQAHASALKAVDPAIKVSVNVSWREVATNPWNLALAGQDYYDAVTLHRYIGHPETAKGAAGTLGARREMIRTAEALRKVFPGKPIWLTEWSVEGGDNALSVVAMADTYLGIIARPDLFETAAYFQINAKEALVHFDKKTGKHQLTSFGAAYRIIRDAFEDAAVVASHTTSPLLVTDVDAVSAQAIIKNGKLSIIAVNRSNKPVGFKVLVDGDAAARSYRHRALAFSSVKDFQIRPLAADPLETLADGTAEITLPPLSINRIDLREPAFVSP